MILYIETSLQRVLFDGSHSSWFEEAGTALSEPLIKWRPDSLSSALPETEIGHAVHGSSAQFHVRLAGVAIAQKNSSLSHQVWQMLEEQKNKDLKIVGADQRPSLLKKGFFTGCVHIDILW